MTHAQDMGRGARLWNGLGSPRTVRIIFVGMILYFLVIGGLVLGYTGVQHCLQDYSDENALSLQVRYETSAVDRQLNARVDTIDASDRSRIRANNDASLEFLQNVAITGGNPTAEALSAFRKVNANSAKIFDANEKARVQIANERAANDNRRATAPNPPPPSETC